MAVERRPRTGRVLGRKPIEPLTPVADLVSAKEDAALKELMELYVTHNEQMNAHKKTSEKARKDLFALMKKHKLKDYNHPKAKVNGRECFLEAKIETSEKRAISLDLLKEHVTEDVFMRCISAGVGVVEAEAGKAIANTCAVPVKGNPMVSVKARARK